MPLQREILVVGSGTGVRYEIPLHEREPPGALEGLADSIQSRFGHVQHLDVDLIDLVMHLRPSERDGLAGRRITRARDRLDQKSARDMFVRWLLRKDTASRGQT